MRLKVDPHFFQLAKNWFQVAAYLLFFCFSKMGSKMHCFLFYSHFLTEHLQENWILHCLLPLYPNEIPWKKPINISWNYYPKLTTKKTFYEKKLIHIPCNIYLHSAYIYPSSPYSNWRNFFHPRLFASFKNDYISIQRQILS